MVNGKLGSYMRKILIELLPFTKSQAMCMHENKILQIYQQKLVYNPAGC